MGMNVALCFDDNVFAEEMHDWLEAQDRIPGDKQSGYDDCTVYDLELTDDDNVVRFNSAGYGLYDFSEIPFTARMREHFMGFVVRVYSCQGQDIEYVSCGDDLLTANDWEDSGCVVSEHYDFPKQEDYQMEEDPDDDENCDLCDDEEAYEEAVETFREEFYESLSSQFDQFIAEYV